MPIASAAPRIPPPAVTRDEVDLLVRRAGLTLNAGQKADLAVSFQHLVTLAGKLPLATSLFDEPAFVFHPEPGPLGGPAEAAPPRPAHGVPARAKPAAKTKPSPKALPKASAKEKPRPAAKPAKAKPAAKPAATPARAKAKAKPAPKPHAAAKPAKQRRR